MQGWDSVAVRADVEIGGTDQLFNLLVGRNLQSDEGQPPQIVLTLPLLPGLSGGPKMSKSLGNYVGIAEPPADQFGKLMSIPDELLPDYFQYTTGWAQPEIDAVTGPLGRGELHPNAAKRLLARTVVELYHGAGAGAAAEAQFDRVFKQHEEPDDMPIYVLQQPQPLSRVLAAAGLVASNREGARKIQQGGVKTDGVVATEDATLDPASLPADGVVLQVGRRNWTRVQSPGN
jgi:tyrosyl-tRNA synthetase